MPALEQARKGEFLTKSSIAPLDLRPERFYGLATADQRGESQRDSDRILYSSAFRRLAGVTQIIQTGQEDVFHTRLHHSLKVAQIGRRLTEMLIDRQASLALTARIDPDVVEAASLSHDLGHPPFGHIAETLLDKLARQANCEDGFEGNAQSFRVLTKLSLRFADCPGLDLTRATLNATLKSPWLRDPSRSERCKRWGAYHSERADFHFAREGSPEGQRAVEAQLLDWSDEVAYSVHDLEDFIRCNALPWRRVFESGEDIARRAITLWPSAPADADGRLFEAFKRLKSFFGKTHEALMFVPYEGTRSQQQQLREMTSQLIGRYIKSTSLVEGSDGVEIGVADQEEAEVKILKQIKNDYIISNPSLIAQQNGQKKIIEELFNVLLEATDPENAPHYPPLLPGRLRYLWDVSEGDAVRFVVDCIAGLTEHEAIAFHRRLTSASGASLFDPIVR